MPSKNGFGQGRSHREWIEHESLFTGHRNSQTFGSDVSVTETVRNRLRKAGSKCRLPAKKDFLNPVHRQKRLEFAMNHEHWTFENWGNAVFSDDTIICSTGHGSPRVLHVASAVSRRTIATTKNTYPCAGRVVSPSPCGLAYLQSGPASVTAFGTDIWRRVLMSTTYWNP